MKKLFKVVGILLLIFLFTSCAKKLELQDLQKVTSGDSVGSLLNNIGEPNKKLKGDDAYKAIDNDIKSYQKLNSVISNKDIEENIVNASLASDMKDIEVWQYKFKSNDTDGTYSIYVSGNKVIYTPSVTEVK
ncbi:hypothetical protein P7H41_12520 [Vagococcus fluvialis]|uniref:hypothetical protein n=1 Tax=Vagococcus fluvialis TaxID=2738 RepID=UPI002891BE5F|nr:hypothetical protein [Vagococcus fluvialis]MDT2782777.1 hypothetical protein [Vagococcus fluvialis]